MAVLSQEARQRVAQQFMQQAKGPLTIPKNSIYTSVGNLDDWYNTNAPSANQALPPDARASLSQSDKALMSQLIVAERYMQGA
jgi:hypothetical protein